MATTRLVKYAEMVSQGMDAKNAAIEAGYALTTAENASVRLTPQAIAAGLLPDPDKRAELVAEFERRLEDGLLAAAEQLASKASRGDLAAIRELLDRYFGRPRQGVDVAADVEQRTIIEFAYDDGNED